MEEIFPSFAHLEMNDENTKLMICPFCFAGIPLFTKKTEKGKLYLTVKCECQNYKPKTMRMTEYIRRINDAQKSDCYEHSQPAKKFCVNCYDWKCQECLEDHDKDKDANNHKVFDYKFNILCPLHSLCYFYYCTTCDKNLCYTCRNNHEKTHQFCQLEKGNMELLQEDKSVVEQNTNDYKILMEIKEKIAESTIDPDDYEDQIDELVRKIKQRKEYSYLIELIKSTVEYCQNFLSYELMQLFELIESKEQGIKKFQEDKIMKDHSDCVNYLRELNNSKFASCSDDNTIRIWDFTGCCQKVLKGHTDRVLYFIKLTDGKLASCSSDKTIMIWDVDSGQSKAVLKGHNNEVSYIIELSDGQLASCSNDKTIRIWNIETQKCEMIIEGHKDIIIKIIELKDGQLASGSLDKTIMLWNKTTGELNRTLSDHTSSINYIIELSDGQLSSCSNDRTIRLWNTSIGKCNITIKGHASSVLYILELRNGQLASCSNDTTIRLWNISNGECLVILNDHSNQIYYLLELSDGELVSCSLDKTLKLWNITTGKCNSTLKGHTGGIVHFLELSDGQLISASLDKTIRLWI